MKRIVLALAVIVVLVFGALWYLDSHFCGIAALGPQMCPGD